MDYARQQRDPAKHAIGIAFVVAFHLFIIYALMTGLARTMVEVIKKPLSATIIEEIKPPPPPPPPPKKIVETPKEKAPVQPYVPPPDIPVPQTAEPVISAPVSTPPPAPYVVEKPVVVEAPPAPPPPPKPAIRRGITPIKKENPVYPKQAQKMGIDRGTVVARLNIDEKGNVTSVSIVSATPPKYFDKAVIDALMEWKFAPDGEKYVGEIEINFKLE